MEGVNNRNAQVDQAVVEPELKDTTNDSLKSTAKGPRRRRRKLAGW